MDQLSLFQRWTYISPPLTQSSRCSKPSPQPSEACPEIYSLRVFCPVAARLPAQVFQRDLLKKVLLDELLTLDHLLGKLLPGDEPDRVHQHGIGKKRETGRVLQFPFSQKIVDLLEKA